MVRVVLNDQLKSLGPSAVSVIKDLMMSETAPASVRLQAARDILDRLGWVPPKRPDPVQQAKERDLVELSRYELETLASGNPNVMLDDETLKAMAEGQWVAA